MLRNLAPDRLDRIVFVSPMLYLAFLAEQNVGLQVASEEFVSGNRETAAQATVTSGLWSGVVARLRTREGKLRPGLPRCLDDFASDGGSGGSAI